MTSACRTSSATYLSGQPVNWGERSEPLLVKSMPNFRVIVSSTDRPSVSFPGGPGPEATLVIIAFTCVACTDECTLDLDEQNSSFEEGENLTDSVGLEKQLNNVSWQGGENSIERVILSHCSWIWKTCYTLCAQNSYCYSTRSI